MSGGMAAAVRCRLRVGWFCLLAGFGGFGLWAALAPLDQGVMLPARVEVAGMRQVISMPLSGMVSAVRVVEGQHVTRGALLLEVDRVGLEAKRDARRFEKFKVDVSAVRLGQELKAAAILHWSSALRREAQNILGGEELLNLQEALFHSHREQASQARDELDRQRAALVARLRGTEEGLKRKEQERTLLARQQASHARLMQRGFGSKFMLWESERALERLDGELAALRAEEVALGHEVARLAATMKRRDSDELVERQQALSEANSESVRLTELLTQLELDIKRSLVIAPVAGSIVGLEVGRSGAIVSQGETLMEIVPEGSDLIIAGELPVSLRDKVFTGAKVSLSFSSFHRHNTPKVSGRLEQIAADSQNHPRTGQPYYRVQARLDREAKEQLDGLPLTPGIPVELFVVTGERSLLSYLFKPLRDRMQTALTEP